MNTLKEFIEDFRLTFCVEEAASNPNMEDWVEGVKHFTCIFTNANLEVMKVPFSQGPGLKHQPTAEDVLDCLASDASGVAEDETFEDWCGEFGYDADSRKAYATFQAVLKQSDELETFLGWEAYQQLLWNTERL